MKKFISFILITVLFLFSACDNKNKPEGTPQTTVNDKTEVIEMTEKEKILNGLTDDADKISLANEGNTDRIKALMKKAEAGGTYTIAVLGGSISEGTGSTSQENCYGYHVKEWWVKSFPNAEFKFVNGGLGGTNPEMACYRYARDIGKFKPDFTVIDFTQNTFLDKNIKVSYANLVHKLLTDGSAVMAVYFTRCNPDEYKKGNYVEVPDIKVPHDDIKYVVERYDLPAVDTDKYIWKYMNDKITWSEIYSDYIHPNDQGHKLCANLITLQLENIKASLDNFDGTITKIPELKNDKYITADCISAKSMGVTARGCFKPIGDNGLPSSRGWYVSKGEGSLTVMLPENVKKARLFVSFHKTDNGYLLLTSKDGTTQKIEAKSAVYSTLIDIKLDYTKLITVTSGVKDSPIIIHYIGLEY